MVNPAEELASFFALLYEVMSLNYTVLATGALGLTVALAWNTAANKVITGLFPHDGSTKASVAYAFAVTFFVIALVAAINHVGEIVGTPELPELDAARETMSSNIVDIRWPAQRGTMQWDLARRATTRDP